MAKKFNIEEMQDQIRLKLHPQPRTGTTFQKLREVLKRPKLPKLP